MCGSTYDVPHINCNKKCYANQSWRHHLSVESFHFYETKLDQIKNRKSPFQDGFPIYMYKHLSKNNAVENSNYYLSCSLWLQN